MKNEIQDLLRILKDIQSIDLDDMESMADGFPELLSLVHLDLGIVKYLENISREEIAGICVIGMGGSSIAGSICKGLLLSKSNIPIEVIRNYDIPHYIDTKWIVIAISYSGNTAETISSLEQAIMKNCRVTAITSGGKIGDILKNLGVPYQVIPPGFQPRAAFPILFSVLMNELEIILGFERTEFQLASKKIQALRKQWNFQIINELTNSILLFIGANNLAPVAYRAKCQINENSKSVAFSSEIPEVNHNEIESIVGFKEFAIIPIFLRSCFESVQLHRRLEATIEIYKSYDIPVHQLKFKTDSLIDETLAQIHFLDVLSVKLARQKDVNPASIEVIARLKGMLSGDN